MGCANGATAAICQGYEQLMADITVPISAGVNTDSWTTIPNYSATFEGNDNLIDDDPIFGTLSASARVRNLIIDSFIETSANPAGIIANTLHGRITASAVAGNISSSTSGAIIGGIVGLMDGFSQITSSWASAVAGTDTRTTAALATGLLAGQMGNGDNPSISDAYAKGLAGGSASGSAIGSATSGTTMSRVYYDSVIAEIPDNNRARTTTQLQAPTGATGIYSGWDTSKWDFGTASQYPALKANVDSNTSTT